MIKGLPHFLYSKIDCFPLNWRFRRLAPSLLRSFLTKRSFHDNNNNNNNAQAPLP